MKRFALPLVLTICSVIWPNSASWADRRPTPYVSEAEKKARYDRSRQLVRLYLSRFERNVTQEVLPFALANTDKDADIRSRAIIALGRIEDPQAEAPLQKLLDQLQDEQTKKSALKLSVAPVDMVPLFRLKLALGRIRARNLKGTEKLNTIAQSIDLTWEKVQEMGDQLSEAATPQSTHRDLVRGSYELEVVREFVDVLHSMGRQGENLDALGAIRLAYFGTIQSKLTASHLSRTDEAKFWLEQALPPTKSGFYPEDLAGLGNEIKPVLMQYLKKALVSLQKDHQDMTTLTRNTLSSMFKSAAATGDLQFAPVLMEFVKFHEPKLRPEASYALDALLSGSGTLILPRNPNIE